MSEQGPNSTWVAVTAIGTAVAGLAAVAALFLAGDDKIIIVPVPAQQAEREKPASPSLALSDEALEDIKKDKRDTTSSFEPPLPSAAPAPSSATQSPLAGTLSEPLAPDPEIPAANGPPADPFTAHPAGSAGPPTATPDKPEKKIEFSKQPTGQP